MTSSEPGTLSKQAVCIDACLAAQWIVPEPLSAQALALYEDSIQGEWGLVSTFLLPFEVTGAIYKRVWRAMSPTGLLTLAEAQELLNDLASFRIRFETYAEIHAHALALAHQFGL